MISNIKNLKWLINIKNLKKCSRMDAIDSELKKIEKSIVQLIHKKKSTKFLYFHFSILKTKYLIIYNIQK